MTIKEHAVMIGMFAMLLETQYTILDILKSRGILEDDDMLAFFSARPREASARSMENARAVYALLAKGAGLDIGGFSDPIEL